jgi:hypothetical protein
MAVDSVLMPLEERLVVDVKELHELGGIHPCDERTLREGETQVRLWVEDVGVQTQGDEEEEEAEAEYTCRPEATPRAPFDLIADAIDVVIFMSRADGVRRVEEALRVLSFDGDGYVTEPLVSRSLCLVRHGDSP